MFHREQRDSNTFPLGHRRKGVAIFFIYKEEFVMQWVYLIFAGLLECVWSTTMKLSNGFSHLWWSIETIIGLVLSFLLLALSLKRLDLSLAYPIWTGIGAVGSILVGLIFFNDQISPLTWLFIAFLIIGIIGIKVTS